MEGPDHVALVFVELGAAVLALSLLARVAGRLSISPIPLYLLAGLALGEGGLADLDPSQEFVEVGSEIGVVLLLLMLGLEYSAADLGSGLRRSWPVGLVDLIANFGPGFLLGLLLGWDWRAAVVLGGVTYISSSGVVAKVLGDLGRLGNRETPAILSVLVLEDLAMAAYLPLVATLLVGESLATGAVTVSLAIATVVLVLYLGLRHGARLSRLVSSPSDEVLMLTVLGLTLLVAGVAQRLDVSAGVGAFLVGIAVSGPVSERSSTLLAPLRDLFAATFFLFFGFQVEPGELPRVLPLALGLAVVTGVTKLAVGMWAAARSGSGRRGRLRAGTALIARGEFSIVVAGLGVTAGIESDLGPLSAAYVLVTAIAMPIVTRFADRAAPRPAGRASPAPE